MDRLQAWLKEALRRAALRRRVKQYQRDYGKTRSTLTRLVPLLLVLGACDEGTLTPEQFEMCEPPITITIVDTITDTLMVDYVSPGPGFVLSWCVADPTAGGKLVDCVRAVKP